MSSLKIKAGLQAFFSIFKTGDRLRICPLREAECIAIRIPGFLFVRSIYAGTAALRLALALTLALLLLHLL